MEWCLFIYWLFCSCRVIILSNMMMSICIDSLESFQIHVITPYNGINLCIYIYTHSRMFFIYRDTEDNLHDIWYTSGCEINEMCIYIYTYICISEHNEEHTALELNLNLDHVWNWGIAPNNHFIRKMVVHLDGMG